MTLPPELSPPPLLRLWDVLPEARIVGGAVRDHLARRPVADIDLATPLPPGRVTEILEAAAIRVIPTGLAHGTVTALVDGQAFEVTTLRRDVETDGRHAVVAFTDDWQADAARRDFTFNALSMDRAGALFDFCGGADDLAAGRVRFVGDPRTRIAEDHLRLLRFFRFFARYGREPPDAPTADALREAAPMLALLSAERVWTELQRILVTAAAACVVRRMERLGVLAWAVPGPLDTVRFAALVARGLPAEPLLRLAALSKARLSKAGCDTLTAAYRLSSAEQERLQGMRGDAPADDADDAALRRALDEAGRQAVLDRIWLQGRSTALAERVAALPQPAFPVQGRDLVALGMAPGRELGQRLAELRRIWRDGGCVASRHDLLAQLVPPPAA